MTTLPPGYQPVPLNSQIPSSLSDATNKTFGRQLAECINRILVGKLNIIIQFSLRAGQTTTTVIDSRISMSNGLLLDPLTSNAAAALTTTYALASDRTSGSAIFTHANAGSTDRTFNLIIIG